MSLLERQIAFRDEIAAADDACPPSSPGMEIYRDAYRGRLMAALEVSFERTRLWVGEEAFTTAACHYVLTNPPQGWTLDDYGTGFPEVLSALFGQDPEVGELAWLEWHMQRAFAAPDAPELDAATLAGAGLADREWDSLVFAMAPGFSCRPVATDVTGIWASRGNARGNEYADVSGHVRANGDCLLVWRSGLMPRFRVAGSAEYRALSGLAGGSPLGRIAVGTAPDELGRWLAQWLSEGIFSAFSIPDS